MVGPDWMRIFPDADHRWVMGLKRSSLPEFFTPCDPTGAVLAERASWLAADPEKYAALLPETAPALRDTVDLAHALGTPIDRSLAPFEQLLALGRTWECDFVWMHPDGNQEHRLIGGVVCFPSYWALREKLGLTMSQTHQPVPGLNTTLDRQIEAFFARLVPGIPWERENANYSGSTELNQHPTQRVQRLDAKSNIENIMIRLEHQLLLKFAASGSTLFAIRIEVVPLLRLREQPEAAQRLARLLETMSSEAARYKNVDDVRGTIIAWLRGER